MTEDQLDFEITGHFADLSRDLLLHRRWTLSDWLPSNACPSCGAALREVSIKTVTGHLLVLALCAHDHRLWVHDEKSGINYPIPVTSYYNELMLKKKVHDPATVLHPKRLFTDLKLHSDADLTAAFSSYNRMRRRVSLGEPLVVPTESSKGWFDRATRWLLKGG